MPQDRPDPVPLALALTMGDPAGIGPEITLSIWQETQRHRNTDFVLLACPALMADRAHRMGIEATIVEVDPADRRPPQPGMLAVAPLDNPVKGQPGRPERKDAPAIVESIERAVEWTLAGDTAAVVTNPIAKSQLYDAGFEFPGHTEFLGALATRHLGTPVRSVMMLAGPKLRTVPVTVHIPLKQVSERLTIEAIVETAEIVAAELADRFAIARPRLAIAGLNPHAGESGALGAEDAEIVAPAIAVLKAKGIDAMGPVPADTMFHDRARQAYDAALCMYHDQALIPAKALDFDETVNVTLGLPFIRTSPDHGTAFDIAGKGLARADSLGAAIRMARQLAINAGTNGDRSHGRT